MKRTSLITSLTKIIIFLIIFYLLLSPSLIYASENSQDILPDQTETHKAIDLEEVPVLYDDIINIEAEYAILLDFITGNILWEKNSKIQTYPASLTKMMTAILVIENIEDLNQTVLISDNAAGVNHSVFWFSEGDQITIIDLLKSALISSHNNATIALGEFIAGTNEDFIMLMNEKALDIGALSTNFENSNGLDSKFPDHKTTAYDMALIAQYCMQNDLFREIVNTKYDTISLNDEDILLESTNKLLKYDFIKGIKTGYTENAGFCLASFSSLDESELIAIVMNSSYEERENDIIKLFEWAHENIEYSTIIDSNEVFKTITLGSDTKVNIDLYASEDISKMVHKTSNHINIEYNIEPEKLTLPFDKTNQVGSIEVLVNNKTIGKTGIISKTGIDAPNIIQNISENAKKQKLIVLISIFTFYFFIIIFIILKSLLLKKDKWR